MSTKSRYVKTMSKQRGAVLLASLLILLVMTMLGVTSMESGGLQMKMTSNTRERQIAFETAEIVLATIEQEIQDFPFDSDQLQDCVSGDADCFDDTCAGGLCFNGTFPVGSDFLSCGLEADDDGPTDYWEDDTLWASAARHLTKNLPNVDNDPKYIIEFLCYVQPDESTALSATVGSPYFRITTLAESNGGKAEVMLQSTYRRGD